MLPTNVYTVTLTAGGTQKLFVAGEFFKIISATGAVLVRSEFGALSGIQGGQGLEDTPFKYLDFTDLSGAPNVLSVVIGDRRFIDTRSTGTVALSSTVVARLGTVTSAAFNVTNASQTLLAANAARQYLCVQNNDGVGIVYVNLAGAAATAANSIRLDPGDSYEPATVPVGAITVIGSLAANGNVVVVEGA